MTRSCIAVIFATLFAACSRVPGPTVMPNQDPSTGARVLERAAGTADVADIRFHNATSGEAGLYTSWAYDNTAWFTGPQRCVKADEYANASIDYNHPSWGPWLGIVVLRHKTCEAIGSAGARFEFSHIKFANHVAIFAVRIEDTKACVAGPDVSRCEPLR